ncbi:MAG: hypothetical protein IJ572_05205 [Bacilli bacterium]|nr:hypothetical protein [Bacilli bacterium]
MKNIFKNSLFTFILGAFIFGGITFGFAYSLSADEIDFTPKNNTWKVEDVKNAIDDIHEKYINIINSSVDVIYVCSGTNSCTGTNLEVNKAYFCVVNTRNYNGIQTITGANVLYNQEYGAYLDYKYSTYRSFIIPTQASVTFKVSNANGMEVSCYHLVNIYK